MEDSMIAGLDVIHEPALEVIERAEILNQELQRWKESKESTQQKFEWVETVFQQYVKGRNLEQTIVVEMGDEIAKLSDKIRVLRKQNDAQAKEINELTNTSAKIRKSPHFKGQAHDAVLTRTFQEEQPIESTKKIPVQSTEPQQREDDECMEADREVDIPPHSVTPPRGLRRKSIGWLKSLEKEHQRLKQMADDGMRNFRASMESQQAPFDQTLKAWDELYLKQITVLDRFNLLKTRWMGREPAMMIQEVEERRENRTEILEKEVEKSHKSPGETHKALTNVISSLRIELKHREAEVDKLNSENQKLKETQMALNKKFVEIKRQTKKLWKLRLPAPDTTPPRERRTKK